MLLKEVPHSMELVFFPRGYTLETFGKVAFFNDYIKKHNP